MYEKMKLAEQDLKIAIYLMHVAFLCLLIIFPLKAEACGWYGDGEDDDDESILVGTDGRPAHDENDLIIE